MAVKPRRSKAEIRKRRTIKIITILIVAAVILTGGILFLRRRVETEYASKDIQEATSVQVTVGSIHTTVSGSGVLSGEGITDCVYPAAVSIEKLLVEEGDWVEQGQALALVKQSTVLSAMAQVQEQMDTLDGELNTASSDAVSSQIKSGVAGRLKAVFAEKDADVASVMYEHGALALISLDGYMSVELETGEYAVGDSVSVVTSDGKTYEGLVCAAQAGSATVLLTDNGPAYLDPVTVDGTHTGILTIHEPLKITGYAGRVSSVNVQPNTLVYTYTTLFTLTDTSYSANYNQILEERAELEEVLSQLIEMYQTGSILAKSAGRVDNITEEDSTAAQVGQSAPSSSGSGDLTAELTLLTIDPEEEMTVTISVDETDILALQTGQSVSIGVESVGEDTYSGTVTQIDTTATSGSGVTYYSAVITLPRQPGMMEGMTATASVTIEGVDNALLLPVEAVKKTSASAYVYTEYEEESGTLGGMVEVTTGLSNGSYIEIAAGLQEGDTVYYTEQTQQNNFGSFGSMPGGNGSSGGRMPSGGSGMPSGGSGMPSGNGGGMPSGNGGGMPGGGNFRG